MFMTRCECKLLYRDCTVRQLYDYELTLFALKTTLFDVCTILLNYEL